MQIHIRYNSLFDYLQDKIIFVVDYQQFHTLEINAK